MTTLPSTPPPGTTPRTASRPRSFLTLDALRGVAALPVIFLHLSVHIGNRVLVRHGYLAVDFFFLLSGFVMTYVYQQRLDDGWSTRDFLKTRILRLYPLYFLGLLLGAVAHLLPFFSGNPPFPFAVFCKLVALNLFFLPTPPSPLLPSAPVQLYPLNLPAWSLFFELAANAVHSLLLRRRSTASLLSLAVPLGFLLLAAAHRIGHFDFGSNRTQYPEALCRVLFSYITGMALYKLWESGRCRLKLHPALIVLLLLAAVLASVPERSLVLYEWLVIVALFPLLLLAGATSQPSASFTRIAKWLGAVSYPAYILHVPLSVLYFFILGHLLHPAPKAAFPFFKLLFILLLLPLAQAAGSHFDPEARKLLQWRPRRRSAPALPGNSHPG